ncbi:unnamed protein product, partial [Symbiodinium sp. CCMP2456]
MTTRTAGKVKLFSDGHGLASPGRWPPHARPCADLDPGLSLHKSLMDKLLSFVTANIDYKTVVCFLATGKCVSSPFSEDLLKRARHLVFGVLRDQGSTAPLELVPERQPFYLHAISELLRMADGPDWRQYTELRDNYRSVDGFEAKVEQQFEKEIALGAMVKMDLREAQELFGDRLSIASLGCIPKTDGSVRVVHDGAHGQHVNDSIRVRDGQAYPSGADLEATLHSLPYATFSLSGDISRAHRLSKAWVGYCHGKDETSLLSYVDDLLWITQSSDGLLRILASILLLSVLGVPFAWHKFSGGGEHSWIGYSLCVAKRTVGISMSRADWIIGWIRKTRADGMEHFRTDAKAQGSELWVGGWCCADDANPRRCRWFSEKIDHLKFPLFFMAGQSYRAIGALEMLATLIALLLFEPAKGTRGVHHCSAGTDNRGNAFITARWMTSSFPLNAVLMEVAAILLQRSLHLELHWTPRLQNALADALTNQQYDSFDPTLRLRFDFSKYKSVILNELMDA